MTSPAVDFAFAPFPSFASHWKRWSCLVSFSIQLSKSIITLKPHIWNEEKNLPRPWVVNSRRTFAENRPTITCVFYALVVAHLWFGLIRRISDWFPVVIVHFLWIAAIRIDGLVCPDTNKCVSVPLSLSAVTYLRRLVSGVFRDFRRYPFDRNEFLAVTWHSESTMSTRVYLKIVLPNFGLPRLSVGSGGIRCPLPVNLWLPMCFVVEGFAVRIDWSIRLCYVNLQRTVSYGIITFHKR